MQDPGVIDIETVPGTLEQIQTYKDVKCSRCDHNPEDHPKQKKDYCAECWTHFSCSIYVNNWLVHSYDTDLEI